MSSKSDEKKIELVQTELGKVPVVKDGSEFQ